MQEIRARIGWRTTVMGFVPEPYYAAYVRSQTAIIRENPEEPRFRYHLINVYRTHGDAVSARAVAIDAIPVYARVYKLFPERIGDVVGYAMVLAIAGRNKEALTVIADVLSRPDLSEWVLYNSACVLSIMGEIHKANSLLQRVLDIGGTEEWWKDNDLTPLHGDSEYEHLTQAMKVRLAAK